MTYLEILFNSVIEIIDSEGINPISRIEVSEEVFSELASKSASYLKQVIGYPIYLKAGMTQPYRIFRKNKYSWNMVDADFEIEIVYCNVCRKELSIKKGEDFFIETEDESYVLCEEHWLEFDKDNKLLNQKAH